MLPRASFSTRQKPLVETWKSRARTARWAIDFPAHWAVAALNTVAAQIYPGIHALLFSGA